MIVKPYENPAYMMFTYNSRLRLDSVKDITNKLIQKYDGLTPVIEPKVQTHKVYWDRRKREYQPRITAQWKVNQITKEQYSLLLNVFKVSVLNSEKAMSKAEYTKMRRAPLGYVKFNGEMTRRSRGYPIYEGCVDERNISSQYRLSDEKKILWVVKDYPSVSAADEDMRSRGKNYWFHSEGDFTVNISLESCKEIEFIDSVVRISCILNGKYSNINTNEAAALAQKWLVRRDTKKVRQSDLIGLEEVIEDLKFRHFMQTVYPGVSNQLGVTDESTLLVGVPGCGKTSIAASLLWDAQLENIPFFSMNVGELLEASYQSDKEIDTFFSGIQEMNQRYGLRFRLWCDDLEAAFLKDMVGFKESATSQSLLLNRLEGIHKDFGVKLSGSTNYPEKIDPRFFEFGRISYLIHIPIPKDQAIIEQILQSHISNREQTIERGLPVSHIAEKIKGYTPRMMVSLVNEAGIQAGKRIFKNFSSCGNNPNDQVEVKAQDYESAIKVINEKSDIQILKRRDNEIGEFVYKKNKNRIGF